MSQDLTHIRYIYLRYMLARKTANKHFIRNCVNFRVVKFLKNMSTSNTITFFKTLMTNFTDLV